MSLAFMLRFMLILLAMLAAAAAGFVYARNQEKRRSEQQITVLTSEVARMRRRTAFAEAEASRAEARLSQEKRRARRL